MVEKYKRIFVYLILSLFLISFISAVEIKFTGEQNTQVDVTESCSFSNLPCPTTFNCNLTIINPSQQILVSNQLMTRNDNIYNYTLNSTQTSSLGVYRVDPVYCLDGTSNGTSSFFFEITPSGSEPLDSGEGFTLFGLLIVLIIATLFFLVFAIFSKNVPFKMFFGALSLLFMIGTVGFGVTITQQLFGTFTQIISGYNTFYRLLIILLGGGGVGLMIYLIYVGMQMLRKQRGIIGLN